VSDQPQPSAVWTEVNELFHQALDLPKAERRAFVDSHASARPDVQRQVLSLLASHERTGTFLEGRAADSRVLERDIDPLIGQPLGHYQIERVLGRGGMGIVYLARDTKLGRTVALKSLPSEFAGDPRRRERLSHEARAAAGLTDPGIATVYALEEIDGRLFIASEHIVGHSLRDELSGGPMSPADAMATAAGIARALATAHFRGVVHCDLKPENVMRTEAGAIKILDFGLARALTGAGGALTATTDARLFGTPAYMAPEQVRGNEVRFSADQFSFGVLLYELLTGTNPFAGPDAAASIARILDFTPPSVSDRIPAGFAHAAGVSALAAVVERCLQKDPSQRFASSADLLAAIEAAEFGTSRRADHSVWWWRFHQGLACTFYASLLVPLWFADERIGGSVGIALFLIALVAAIVTITLRLHLWFVTQSYPQQWAAQRRQAIGWKRAADLLYVAAFAISGLALLGVARLLALVLVGAGVLIFLASAFIEPATERAAFGSDQSVGP
jgi:Protein kinase domain